jgi:hypothetical protein
MMGGKLWILIPDWTVASKRAQKRFRRGCLDALTSSRYIGVAASFLKYFDIHGRIKFVVAG